jgi:hypothetical protein
MRDSLNYNKNFNNKNLKLEFSKKLLTNSGKSVQHQIDYFNRMSYKFKNKFKILILKTYSN